MKKFIKSIFLFGILTLICASCLDSWLSYQLCHNQNRIYASWGGIYNDTIQHDLVINGNSRAWGMYSPRVLDSVLNIKSYNLGIDGSAINRQMIKYDKYYQLHGAPKYLIQNIDYCTMAVSYGYEREQFFPYFIFDRDLMRQYNQYENFSWAEKYVPCYRYLGYYDVILEGLMSKNTKYYFQPIEKGYAGKTLIWNRTKLDGVDSVIAQCDLEMLARFEKFIINVQKQGTQVVFVYAPIYFEVNNKLINRSQMEQMYSYIADRYSIPILDYNEHTICYDTANFYDANHLNKLGSERFSTQLAYDLDSLGIIN